MDGEGRYGTPDHIDSMKSDIMYAHSENPLY